MESTKVKNMKEYLNLKRNYNGYKYYQLLEKCVHKSMRKDMFNNGEIKK